MTSGAGVTTLFAFLHHLAAFTLVSALAIELMLIHQKLTVANIRRLLVADAIPGVSAGTVPVVGPLRGAIHRRCGSAF